MVFLCCSSADGPTLGRKCLTNMATKLAKIIANMTGFEPPNAMFQLPSYINTFLNDKLKDKRENFKEKKSNSANVLSNLKRFTQSTQTFSNSIIDSTTCWLKRKKKATLFVTPLHLLVFSSAIVQNTQVRNYFFN